MDRDTPFLECFSHDVGGALFLIAKLGMRVEIAANCLNFGLPIEKGL
jgi:hypothetical protein